MEVHACDSSSVFLRRRELTWWQLCGAAYHWATWLFICIMVFSQFLCIAWDSTAEVIHQNFGRDPRKGIEPIVGRNDAPFADRVVACMLDGSDYKPQLVHQVLETDKATLIDDSGTYKVGYRVVDRRMDSKLDLAAFTQYQASCSLIADTFNKIYDACTALGYSDLTRDHLRVALNEDTFAIADSLPVLIMPFFDNSPAARHAIPSLDGDACVFRLDGAYIDASVSDAIFRGANKSIRNSRTIEWLDRRGGTWQHGWYVDPTGVRWSSDVVSTYPTTEFETTLRQFDTRTGKEINCAQTTACNVARSSFSWGSNYKVSITTKNLDSIYVGNASQHGLFLYRSTSTRVITSKYDWETLLSNASISLLLARWLFSTLALYHGYFRRETKWRNGGIWCLTGARNFNLLVFSALPRLKMVLCAICTVGCNFEGNQLGLSNAWFAIYPAIVEFVLLYYSLLNIVAKMLRRRVTDALFAPTIIVLCLVHYFRLELSYSGWFRGIQARVPTLVSSDEVKKLSLVDFFRSDVALRLNGNVRELFIGKLVLFGVNLLLLAFAKSLPNMVHKKQAKQRVSQVEWAMAFISSNVGGLGGQTPRVNKRSAASKRARISPMLSIIANLGTLDGHQNAVVSTVAVSTSASHPSAVDKPLLLSSELIRLGYVVYGGKFVIKFDDWDIISTFAPLRSFFHLWNHRVTVWTLKDVGNKADKALGPGGSLRRRGLLRLEPEIVRLDDPRLLDVPFWHISASDIE